MNLIEIWEGDSKLMVQVMHGFSTRRIEKLRDNGRSVLSAEESVSYGSVNPLRYY